MTSIELTATSGRFLNFALAVLANPSAYSAAQVEKSSALVHAYNAGNSVSFLGQILDW